MDHRMIFFFFVPNTESRLARETYYPQPRAQTVALDAPTHAAMTALRTSAPRRPWPPSLAAFFRRPPPSPANSYPPTPASMSAPTPAAPTPASTPAVTTALEMATTPPLPTPYIAAHHEVQRRTNRIGGPGFPFDNSGLHATFSLFGNIRPVKLRWTQPSVHSATASCATTPRRPPARPASTPGSTTAAYPQANAGLSPRLHATSTTTSFSSTSATIARTTATSRTPAPSRSLTWQ